MSTSGTSRRGLIAGVVALVPVAATGTRGADIAPATHPDADLIALSAAHIVNLTAYETDGGILECDNDPLWDAYMETRDALCDARPQTLDGLIAKAQAAQVEAGACPAWDGRTPDGGAASEIAWTLVGDLLRLGGQA